MSTGDTADEGRATPEALAVRSDDRVAARPDAQVAPAGTRTPDAYESRYMGGSGMVLHRHKIKAPWQLHAALGGGTLAAAIPLLTAAWPVGVIMFPIMLALWLLFSVLRTTVSEGEVNVQYGLFGPTIPVEAIEEAEATTYDWKKFGGWGIRRNMQGEWAYTMPGDGGNAVRIRWRDARGKDKVTVIGTRDAVALSTAIASARAALASVELPDALPAGSDRALGAGEPND